MACSETPPLVIIGIDAAEITVIDRLLRADRLPNIARLRRSGSRAILGHRHGGLQSSVWRTFISGRLVTGHGVYFIKLWQPELMRLELLDDEMRPVTPFWALPAERRRKAALVDLPYLPAQAAAAERLVSGWQCHDYLPRCSLPDALWTELESRHGPPSLGEERYGRQTAATLEEVRVGALRAVEQIGRVCGGLLERERFDLFAVVLGSAHRAGHYLWDLSQIDADQLPDDRRLKLEQAIEDVYVACDTAIGRIVAAAPHEARIVLLAMHGMGPNPGWNENVAPLLSLAAGEGAERSIGLRDLLRRLHQAPAVRRLTQRVPRPLQEKLTPLWTRRAHDWSRTRFLALPSDVNAYIRLNLIGRESAGVVLPGAQADALLAELGRGFLELEDLATGAPVCRGVELIDAIAGAGAPMRQVLPDLVALWGDQPYQGSIGARRPGVGERRWPRVRRLVSGRAGNHRPDGWLVASGPGIAAGRDLGRVAAVDAVATFAEWLGTARPELLDGRPLAGLRGDVSEPAPATA